MLSYIVPSIVCSVVFVIAYNLGKFNERKRFQIHAVKWGHAEWVPYVDGSVVFRWNDFPGRDKGKDRPNPELNRAIELNNKYAYKDH